MSTQPPDKSSGRRRNRGASEKALIAAALEEFSARGYAATTTRAIALRVGCSEALIQNYFGGKEGLLTAVLADNVENVRRQALSFVSRPVAPSLAAEVRDTMEFAVLLLRRSVRHVRILVERSLGDRAFGQRFAELIPRQHLCEGLAGRLAQWPLVEDAEGAAELVVSLSFELGFVHPELLGRGDAEVEELIDRMAPRIAKAIVGGG